MNRKLVLDYIRASVNLYGVVLVEQVVEIYNQHNDDHVGYEDVAAFLDEDLSDSFVYSEDGFFVHESIDEFDEMDELLLEQGDKPYYMPERDEFLKHADMNYYDIPPVYYELFEYVKKNFIKDEYKAEMVCEDIIMGCIMGFDFQYLFDGMNKKGISFENEQQANEMIPLIMELNNNVRIWENRGHTPDELFVILGGADSMPLPSETFGEKLAKPQLRVIEGGLSKKVGRNDPCLCGSGNKYKKCCLGKDES